jgi:hypothetical protein
MAHVSQYFSTIVMFSPTSKQASCVAKFAQVIQYFNFFSLIVVTKGLRVSKNFAISLHFVSLPMNAIFNDVAIIADESIKNVGLLSFLSVITCWMSFTHKNVLILAERQSLEELATASRVVCCRSVNLVN